MVDRYGAAIEADLHRVYTLDLLDFFRGKFSWRKLKSLLNFLPAGSMVAEAIANDTELAEQLLEAEKKRREKSPDTGPRVSEYSPEVQRLDNITDAIAYLTATVINVVGGKARQPRPAKRPETAFTRARQAATMARHHELLDEVAQAQARWAEKHNK